MHKIYLKIILPGKYFHCVLPFFHFQSIFLSFERNVLTRFRQTRRFLVSVNPYQSDLRFIYKKVAWIRIIVMIIIIRAKNLEKKLCTWHILLFLRFRGEKEEHRKKVHWMLPSDVLILIFHIVIIAVFFLNNNNNISFICMTIIT